MSMIEPNENTILWNKFMALQRYITRASRYLQQGAVNGIPMNNNARENKNNLRLECKE